MLKASFFERCDNQVKRRNLPHVRDAFVFCSTCMHVCMTLDDSCWTAFSSTSVRKTKQERLPTSGRARRRATRREREAWRPRRKLFSARENSTRRRYGDVCRYRVCTVYYARHHPSPSTDRFSKLGCSATMSVVAVNARPRVFCSSFRRDLPERRKVVLSCRD